MTVTELLAPAGSEAALYAAVQSGADAVYVGGSRFSARASANNFDEEAMQRAVRYCHLHGVKLYVTQNTLLKQSELSDAVEYARFLHSIGIDGLIVQDLGLARMVAQCMPEFELHGSTQMTVHNLEGVRVLEKLGFSRVVLARELSARQIAYIAKHCKAELEIFVHGALCYCYSGQCLLSSLLGGRSGNRGRCAQPCRLPYTLVAPDGKKVRSGYLMSPKDLALLDDLDELCKMGVASLKIEGRLKKPAYVATVTGVYRNILDTAKKATKADWQTLLDAFNRSGFTNAYFKGARGIDMMSVNNPSNVSEERFSAEAEARCTENANHRRVGVSMSCALEVGMPAQLTVQDADGNCVSVCGDVVQAAQSRPGTEEEIAMRLAKTGTTVFYADAVSVQLVGDVFMPVSAINALRRAALDALEEKRCVVERSAYAPIEVPKVARAKRAGQFKIFVSVETMQQALAALKYNPDVLYAPAAFAQKLVSAQTTVIAKLPEILTQENRARVLSDLQADSVLASGVDAFNDIKAEIHMDFRTGIYNAQAAHQLFEMGAKYVTVSPELNFNEIAALGDAVLRSAVVIGYGRLSLMVMQNCLMRAYCGKCMKGQSGFVLRDRKNVEFPVLCRPEACTNVLLNSKPIYMADKLRDFAAAGVCNIRLDFTTESAEETDDILRAYTQAIRGETVPSAAENTFTRGHFYRGVQ